MLNGRTRLDAKSCGTATLACVSCFTIALLWVHVPRPDYAPRVHFISDYAVGPWRWVMTTAFVALGRGRVALGVGLFRADRHSS